MLHLPSLTSGLYKSRPQRAGNDTCDSSWNFPCVCMTPARFRALKPLVLASSPLLCSLRRLIQSLSKPIASHHRDQPSIIFPSTMPPNLMSKQLLPMNPPFVGDLLSCPDTPRPMSTEPLLEPLILEPPVKPLIPIPWNVHCYQYLSMEDFIKHVMQNPVSHPLDDQDSPMSDMPPLEPEPAMPYLPDSPEGHMHTLSPDKSPTELWQ